MQRLTGLFLRLALVALAATHTASAIASSSVVRIADQFGLSYLPLHVALEHRLIEKHAMALGIADPRVEVIKLASGAAVNDAIIAGNIDIAMAGATVLLNLWDKTVGRNTVKGMMAIADTPIFFNTIEPRIRSIADLGSADRIAMTAGRGTQHALVLQMAAAKAFGWDNREKLDALAVSMAHPDGVVALLNGIVTVHATTVPFAQMELSHPNGRTILNSFDVAGGRHTLIVAYGTERWRQENPKLYQATFAGISEAMQIINADRQAAAALYRKREGSKLAVADIERMLTNADQLVFTPTPSGMLAFANYMARVGLLKNKLADWKDVFFDNLHNLPGN